MTPDLTETEKYVVECLFKQMQKGDSPSDHFTSIWKTINGPDSWQSNPWVWVVSFKKL